MWDCGVVGQWSEARDGSLTVSKSKLNTETKSNDK